MLDPFCKPLIEAVRTDNNQIIVSSMHVMAQIVHLKLPSLEFFLKKLLARIFVLLESTSSTEEDFLNAMFRTTADLLKTYLYKDLSQA